MRLGLSYVYNIPVHVYIYNYIFTVYIYIYYIYLRTRVSIPMETQSLSRVANAELARCLSALISKLSLVGRVYS